MIKNDSRTFISVHTVAMQVMSHQNTVTQCFLVYTLKHQFPIKCTIFSLVFLLNPSLVAIS